MSFVIFFLLLIGPLVFIHELGHFLTCKVFGVYVKTFSVGMGPKILTHRFGETEYVLRRADDAPDRAKKCFGTRFSLDGFRGWGRGEKHDVSKVQRKDQGKSQTDVLVFHKSQLQ